MSDSITRLASISFIGGIFGLSLRYSLNIIIARGFSTAALGLFALGIVVLKTGAVFAKLGFDQAVLKYVPQYIQQKDYARASGTTVTSLSFSFIAGCSLALLMFIFKEDIGGFLPNDFAPLMTLFLIGIPFWATLEIAAAATRGLLETKYSVLGRDIGQPLVAVVLLSISVQVNDFRLAIIGYILSIGVGLAFMIGSFAIRPEFDFQVVRFPRIEFFRFSLPVAISSIALRFVSWSDLLILGFFVSASQIGWYQAAFQSSVLLVFVLQSTNTIFPSIVSDLNVQESRDLLFDIFRGVTRWVGLLTLFGYLILFTTAGSFLTLFGQPTPEAILALLILGAGQSITTFVGPVGTLLTMSGYERLQTVNTVSAAAINIILNLVFIYFYGIKGAALATSLALIYLNIVRVAQVKFLMGITPITKGYLKRFIATLGLLPFLTLLKPLFPYGLTRVAALGGIGIISFGLMMLLLPWDHYDRILLQRLTRK